MVHTIGLLRVGVVCRRVALDKCGQTKGMILELSMPQRVLQSTCLRIYGDSCAAAMVSAIA